MSAGTSPHRERFVSASGKPDYIADERGRISFRVDFTPSLREELLRTPDSLRADLEAHDAGPNHAGRP